LRSNPARIRQRLLIIALVLIVLSPFGVIFWLANFGFDMPLGRAAGRGDLAAVQDYLKEKPEAVNSFPDGSTPLHYAAAQGHLEVVKLLVEHGADWTLVNERGKTAEQWALENHHDAVVEYLESLTPRVEPEDEK